MKNANYKSVNNWKKKKQIWKVNPPEGGVNYTNKCWSNFFAKFIKVEMIRQLHISE